eukprot:gene20515-27306_t
MQFRLLALSAHYNTVLSLLSALRLDADPTAVATMGSHNWLATGYLTRDLKSEYPKIPSPAAILVVELHQLGGASGSGIGGDPSQFAVRLVVQDGGQQNYLTIPLPCTSRDADQIIGGTGGCLFQNFLEYVSQDLITAEPSAWCSLCNNTDVGVCVMAGQALEIENQALLISSLQSQASSPAPFAPPPPYDCDCDDCSNNWWLIRLVITSVILGVIVIALVVFFIIWTKRKKDNEKLQEFANIAGTGGQPVLNTGYWAPAPIHEAAAVRGGGAAGGRPSSPTSDPNGMAGSFQMTYTQQEQNPPVAQHSQQASYNSGPASFATPASGFLQPSASTRKGLLCPQPVAENMSPTRARDSTHRMIIQEHSSLPHGKPLVSHYDLCLSTYPSPARSVAMPEANFIGPGYRQSSFLTACLPKLLRRRRVLDTHSDDAAPLNLSEHSILHKCPILQCVRLVRSPPDIDCLDPVFWMPTIYLSLEGLPTSLKSLEVAADYKTVLDPSALQHARGMTGLQLSHLPITSIMPIVALAGTLQRLDLSGNQDLHEISALGSYPKLTHLNLSACGTLTNFTPLFLCPKLLSLSLSDCQGLIDIAPLRSCPVLRTLNLSGCKELLDISALEACSLLDSLNLAGCGALEDLSPLRACPSLRALDMSSCARVADISPLEGCAQLRQLSLSRCRQWRDVHALASCQALEHLSLSLCSNMLDLAGLEVCHSLRVLDVSDCPRLVLQEWREKLQHVRIVG